MPKASKNIHSLSYFVEAHMTRKQVTFAHWWTQLRKRGQGWASAVGARMEAPRGWAVGGVPLPTWERDWGGAIPPSPENVLILDLIMSTSSAFWTLFFAVQLHVYTQKTLLLGLENSLLSAHRQQKAAKHAAVCRRAKIVIFRIRFYLELNHADDCDYLLISCFSKSSSRPMI